MLPAGGPGADAALRAALLAEGQAHSMSELRSWLAEQQAAMPVKVTRVPLRDMTEWQLDRAAGQLRIVHRSGRFFSVEGVRVRTDFGPVSQWDQPILVQSEVGTLGIITRVRNGADFYLRRRSSRAQRQRRPVGADRPATQTTRVHGGADTKYLEYSGHAHARVLVDQLRVSRPPATFANGTQHGREVDETCARRSVPMAHAGANRTAKEPNLINMDSRTVLACLPLLGSGEASPSHPAVHHLPELLHWLTNLRASHSLSLERRSVDQLDDWILDDFGIRHAGGRYFSVIGVAVDAGCREVRHWEQPLLEHPGFGLNGFILQRINGVLHFLVRACMYPGNHAPSSSAHGVAVERLPVFGQPGAPTFLDLFTTRRRLIRIATQSEEGGRFYHYHEPV